MGTVYGGSDDSSRLMMGSSAPGASLPFYSGGSPSTFSPAGGFGGQGQRIYGAPGYDASGQFVGGAVNNAVSAGTGVNQAASNPMGGGISTTSTGTPYGTSQVAGQVISQSANGGGQNNQFSDLMKSLMTQAQTDYQARMKQYHNLLGSITGPEGLLSGLGKTGENRIAMNEKNQIGKSEQDLVSRGLGNSTIRNTMQGGIHRNAEMERQSLNEGVAGQKANAATQLFGMNPAPGMDTYLNMLTRLGSVSKG